MSVDTLSLARELRAAEIEPAQAEAIAAAIGRAVVETAATKADLLELRAATKADLTELRTSTKADLMQAAAGVDARFNTLDNKVEQQGVRLSGEIKAAVAAVETTIMKWSIGAIFALGGLTLAAAKIL